jgi:uncharacterized protein
VRALLLFVPAIALAQFQLRDVNANSVEVSEGGKPVFVYNHGMIHGDPRVAEDKTRCCYLHPVYAPNGVVITDDFPQDHPHHRGISWNWPDVKVDGKTYDLWSIKGINARFEKWIEREATATGAVIAVQNGWYVGDRKVVEEEVAMRVHPSSNGGTTRDIDFSIVLRAHNANVSLAGTSDLNKGYGGFVVRFSPRAGSVINTATLKDGPDSDLAPNAWAELVASFSGRAAGARVTIDPGNPDFPSGWILRHYGFVGNDFPGLKTFALTSPLAMKFRVTLLADAAAVAAGAAPAAKNVLVYTRNGKGFVHDNIAASVAAIQKMGKENGFHVDATDDPNFITDATLGQYQTIVFSNSNNEAFSNDRQRASFQKFIENGGGLVGIHSATGSERAWPFYWSTIGGKFTRHPKLQKFMIHVADPNHPSTKGMPAEFEWEDECYFHEYWNGNMHPLLTVDPGKLDDPARKDYPAGLFGKAMPLAWTLETGKSRRFYTAIGHKKEYYSNPLVYNHILGGILWTLDMAK